MAGKKLVNRIRNSLTIGSRSPSPVSGPSQPNNATDTAATPFTAFVLSSLDSEDHKMVAMTFASQIQTDCDARNLDFDDLYHLLGHKTKGNALRTLTLTIPVAERIVIKNDKNYQEVILLDTC